MPIYLVNVAIQNKPTARDPEGETILKDLLVKGGYEQVKEVRTAKLLRMAIEAESKEQARRIAQRMCDDLRIYNPAAHTCTVEVKG